MLIFLFFFSLSSQKKKSKNKKKKSKKKNKNKKYGGIQSPYRRHVNHSIKLVHTWRPIGRNSEYSSSSYQLCDSTKSRKRDSRGVNKVLLFFLVSVTSFSCVYRVLGETTYFRRTNYLLVNLNFYHKKK